MHNKALNFIIVSTADWDNPFWTNKQHVAMTLSELGHNVVYFESLGLRSPSKNSSRDLSRILSRLIKFLKGTQQIKSNLIVFSPLVLPKHNSKYISRINNALMGLYLKYFEMRFSGPVIYWTYNPLSGEFLHNKKIIYHCVDDLTAAPGLPIQRIKTEEKKLLNKAEVVFVTSTTLRSKFENLGFKDKVHYFPNVADTKHFAPKSGKLDRSKVLGDKIKGPVLGFIGAISSYKVDFELIKFLAMSNSEWSFVLIGQIGEGQPDTKIDILEALPNVHLLGPKSYKELPVYLSLFDVALLPCVINDYTRSMFPMKFFEYLSAQKKVVTTNLDSLTDFKDCCFYANTHFEFKEGIDKALRVPFSEFCNQSRVEQLLQENTWQVRTEKMLKLI